MLAGVSFVVLATIVATGLWYNIGPSRKIVVTPASTFIVEPLTPSGDVDYAAAFLAKLREQGQDPDKNAAIPFLEAVWPASYNPSDLPRICQELGMQHPTQPGLILWDQSPQAAELGAAAADTLTAADLTPWRRENCPPLAAWLDGQAAPLDKLHQLSSRPQFYLPSPTLLQESDPLLRGIDYPFSLPALKAARALQARAMLAIGERRPEAAWQDVETCFELIRIHNPAGDSIEAIIAISMARIAFNASLALASSPDCDEAMLRRIAAKLDNFPQESFLATTFQTGATFATLQIAQRMAQSRDGDLIAQAYGLNTKMFSTFEWIAYDCDAMSRELNRYLEFHRVVHSISDPAQRYEQARQFDETFHQETRTVVDYERESASTYDQRQRGIRIARAISLILIDPILSLTTVEIDLQMRFRLLRVAVAIEQFQRAAGDYPDSLDDLTDYLPAEKLRDPFSSDDFLYERRESGYLLYSIFVDQEDDAGTDPYVKVKEGEYHEFDDAPTIEESDIVIRIPLPPTPLRANP